jgi:hypothetical protein
MKPNQGSELVAEAEVRELFRRRRPDAKSFREGVAQRIAGAERDGAASSNEPSSHAQGVEQGPRGWRRAAAVLPPELASILLGVGKGWSAALLLPALLLAAAVGAFAASARSIRRSARDAGPVHPAASRTDFERALHAHPKVRVLGLLQFGPLLVMATPFWFGRQHAVDVIFALLLLSMFAVAFAVRGLSKSGLLERRIMMHVSFSVLTTLFMGCFMWSSSLNFFDIDSRLGLHWSGAVTLLGLLALLVLFPRSAPFQGFAYFLVVGLALLGLLVAPGFTTRSSPAAVREFVELDELDVNELRGWSEVSDSVEALAAVGASLPDLSTLRGQVTSAIEQGAEAHPRVWTAAARMKLVGPEHWAQLAQRKMMAYKLDQLLASDGPHYSQDYDEFELHMLLAVRELSASDCELLVRRIERSWPAPGAERALDAAAQCVRWFDLLGRSDLAEARRDDVRAILERHWVADGGAFARIGGFSSFPEKIRSSLPGPTALGVELMARFGAPEAIDLELLRAYLRGESAWSGPLIQSPRYLNATARAALLRFDRQIGLPERGPLDRILGERLLIATLLIVALCLYSVRSARALEEPLALASRGAQP